MLFFLVLSGTGVVYVLLTRDKRAPYFWARSFSAFMRAVLGWRIEVENRERMTAHAPAVFMFNHQSNLDLVTAGSMYTTKAAAIGKKEVAKIPLFGWFFAVTGNILIDRGNLERAKASIEVAADKIRNERISIWVAPEGHRSQERRLLTFKKGAFHLAIAAQIPIVPVVLSPIWTLLDAKRLMVRPGLTRIRPLPPIATTGMTADDVDAVVESVRAAMQGALDEFLAENPERIG